MIKFADYKCCHCGDTSTIQVEVTPPKWDELYAEMICPGCGKSFNGKSCKLMTKAAPEMKVVGGRTKGKQNSQANW
jgi:hypothetical protein